MRLSATSFLGAMAPLLLAVLPARAHASGTVARPNIVFILIDDLRWDDIGCAGHPFVKTPHIDRIAREGARFRNFFATTPLCSPSRASFLTGQYAHTHGIKDNRDNTARSMKLTTFPLLLQRAGYRTAFIGKWHMGTSAEARPGFDHWVSFPFDPFPGKKSSGYIDPEINVNGKRSVIKGYMTDILTEQAIQFIKEARAGPFLLYLAHKALHPEITVPFEQAHSFVPAERHKTLYSGQPIPRAPSAMKKPADKPALTRRIGDLQPLGPKTGTTDETIRNRLRMLAAIDEGVGKLFQVLQETKQLNNTVIVFTSDNGYFYGEHGLSDERRLAYEESIRLPLLLRYPRLIKAGSTPEPLTLNIDLAPTMLELAGVKGAGEMQGRSLVPLFRSGEGTTVRWRKSFLVEYFTDTVRARLPNMGYHAVRSERWTYIRYTELQGMDELYDLQADPYQMTNLIQSASAQPALRKLGMELNRLLNESPGSR